MTTNLQQFFWLLVFLGLPLLLYGLWVIYPTIRTFTLAFTNYDGLSPARWIGWANFKELFQTEAFRLALWHNLIWILIFITIPTSAGLALAMVLNQGVRFDRFLKIAFYLPLVLAPVVTAMVWGWIYHPQQGLLNTVLVEILRFVKLLGFKVDPESARQIGWLGDPRLALLSVIAAAVWRQVGYVMVLYLAGLKTLDSEVLEAAKVDGAEGFNLFRYMIFPMLAPVTTIVVVISIVDSLRSFDLVNVMTLGGPFSTSEVLANYMVLTAFHDYRQGYAAAVAVILFLITFVFTLIYLRQVMAQEERRS
ncbi:MAG: sugar ABC transporter permease [Thermaceae bacterium]|nr:sugar ABC transporter permease [Thermaceae bacterium]